MCFQNAYFKIVGFKKRTFWNSYLKWTLNIVFGLGESNTLPTSRFQELYLKIWMYVNVTISMFDLIWLWIWSDSRKCEFPLGPHVCFIPRNHDGIVSFFDKTHCSCCNSLNSLATKANPYFMKDDFFYVTLNHYNGMVDGWH